MAAVRASPAHCTGQDGIGVIDQELLASRKRARVQLQPSLDPDDLYQDFVSAVRSCGTRPSHAPTRSARAMARWP